MSRPGNALGYRLGYSKDWKTHYNNYLKKKEDINLGLFLYNWLWNNLIKDKNWILNMKITKSDNLYNANILMHYNLRRDKKPLMNRYYWSDFSSTNVYSFPGSIEFIKLPFVYVNPKWVNPRIKQYFKLWLINIHKRNFKKIVVYFKFLEELYFEELFKKKFKKVLSVKNIFLRVKFYDVMVFFSRKHNNTILEYLEYFFNIFLADQRKIKSDLRIPIFYILLGILFHNSSLIANSIANVLSRGKEHKPMLYFFFKIIREMFDIIPKKNRRISYLKIVIKGKIAGNDRTLKQTFSLGNIDKYDGVNKDIALNTKSNNVDFYFTEAYTYTGVLSVKVWTC